MCMCCHSKRAAIGWTKAIGECGVTTTGETIEWGVGLVVLREGGGEGEERKKRNREKKSLNIMMTKICRYLCNIVYHVLQNINLYYIWPDFFLFFCSNLTIKLSNL